MAKITLCGSNNDNQKQDFIPQKTVFSPGTIGSSVSIGVTELKMTTRNFGDSFDIYPTMLKSRIEGLEVKHSEFGLYKIDGHDAGAVLYTAPIPSQTLTNTRGQGLQVLTVIDGKLMTITYTALEDLFDKKLPEVDAMIDSMKIMGAR